MLDLIPRKGRIHPRELEKELGKEREVNAWGGYSKATTRALERLHYFGLIRVAGRVSGIRIYERLTATHTPANPDATSVVWYPNVFYTDIRGSVKVNSHFRFYLGVDNLFNRMPPYNVLGTSNSSIGGISPWSDIGRYYYGGAQVDF